STNSRSRSKRAISGSVTVRGGFGSAGPTKVRVLSASRHRPRQARRASWPFDGLGSTGSGRRARGGTTLELAARAGFAFAAFSPTLNLRNRKFGRRGPGGGDHSEDRGMRSATRMDPDLEPGRTGDDPVGEVIRQVKPKLRGW